MAKKKKTKSGIKADVQGNIVFLTLGNKTELILKQIRNKHSGHYHLEITSQMSDFDCLKVMPCTMNSLKIFPECYDEEMEDRD